ncbi:MAG: hypothetical protein RRB22_04635 [Gammaproteobacteria bacterium]|nr:hypothetical protein [Gammaproteobacteria bacterium]
MLTDHKSNQKSNQKDSPVFFAMRRVLSALVLVGLAACGVEGQDQTVADYAIAYIKRPVATQLDPDTNELVLVQPDVREAIEFNEGGDVYLRERASPSASERNITLCLTDLDGDGIGTGDVRDLESSYDGSKLIFSLRLEDLTNGDDIPKWNIYEYDITVGGCPTRVMASDSLANKGNDVAPAYLPDGRIVFSSSLQRATGAILLDEGHQQFQPLDESQNEPAVVLHVMSADGENVKQISFNQSHDLDASVLASGEIIFSRWDHMGGRNAINLYTVRPDGTELKALYGVHDHAVGTAGSTVQYMAPRELPDGQILVMIKPFTGSAGGGAPARINVAEYADNTQPTWPYQPSGLSGPAQVPAIAQDVRTDGSISPAGRFRSVYPLGDGSNRALVSWSQCRLHPTDPLTGLRLPDATPTPCPDTISAGAAEALPVYGIYVYDLDSNTQLPVVVPQEGVMIDEPVVLAPRERPVVLYDKTLGFELNATLGDEGVGLLHIRSVYDFDGSFNALGGAAADLAEMANPTLTDADARPARFLRIVKAASIPDDDVYDFDNTAFGVSRQQKMREIIGYAAVEPDGSVLTKVPANVPLAISVVDKDGRRIGGRHQNWIQLRPGESLQCTGCHTHTVTAPALPLPHGYSDGPTPLNAGAATIGGEYPGATSDVDPDPMVVGTVTQVMGETMAQARIRTLCESTPGLGDINYAQIACPQLSPNVNPVFSDVWASGAIPDVTNQRYDDTTAPALTSIPASAACQAQWSARCRTVIHYETHIHPLWGTPRTDASMNDRTCTLCHARSDLAMAPRVPDGQLDLSDGPSSDEPDHYESYRELLFQDIQQELDGTGALIDSTVDQLVQGTDANGDPLFEVDPVTGALLLDGGGNPIPVLVTIQVPVPAPAPAMSVNGSRSGSFMGKFLAGGSHAGDLTPAEMRLIAEWLDIGAQYFNSPFAAPED